MNQFQTRLFAWSIVLGCIRYIFITNALGQGFFLGIIGTISIILSWFRLWRRQQHIWFLAMISRILTWVWYIFSIIPVYTAIPSLTAFHAAQFPSFHCIPWSEENTSEKNEWNKTAENSTRVFHTYPQTIQINDTAILGATVCAQNNYPLYVGQKIARQDTGAVIIRLYNGASIYLTGPFSGIFSGTKDQWFSFIITTGTQYGAIHWQRKTIIHPEQQRIIIDFFQARKFFVEKNYTRIRDDAPMLTTIAIRKMRLLRLVDRSYDDALHHLSLYQEYTHVQEE